MTKVSIITVTYNSAATLTRTLRSIEKQTYPEIEHILVDGESSDATMSIIHDYTNRHNNIRFISEKDSGIYEAINKGIKMATGDIIGILNSDDTLASNETIAHIVKTFEETEADLTYGDLVYCRYIDKKLHVVRNWVSNDYDPHSLRFGWMCPHPTASPRITILYSEYSHAKIIRKHIFPKCLSTWNWEESATAISARSYAKPKKISVC